MVNFHDLAVEADDGSAYAFTAVFGVGSVLMGLYS
jgi:hypothetical protein